MNKSKCVRGIREIEIRALEDDDDDDEEESNKEIREEIVLRVDSSLFAPSTLKNDQLKYVRHEFCVYLYYTHTHTYLRFEPGKDDSPLELTLLTVCRSSPLFTPGMLNYTLDCTFKQQEMLFACACVCVCVYHLKFQEKTLSGTLHNSMP